MLNRDPTGVAHASIGSAAAVSLLERPSAGAVLRTCCQSGCSATLLDFDRTDAVIVLPAVLGLSSIRTSVVGEKSEDDAAPVDSTDSWERCVAGGSPSSLQVRSVVDFEAEDAFETSGWISRGDKSALSLAQQLCANLCGMAGPQFSVNVSALSFRLLFVDSNHGLFHAAAGTKALDVQLHLNSEDDHWVWA